MNDLDDGKDNIIQRVTPEDEYRCALNRLKAKYPTTIDVFDSPEFRELKKRLRMVMGESIANQIMEQNL